MDEGSYEQRFMTIGESASYDRINDYASVKISLARPHDIRSWSFGEVKKPETINYRTYRPEKDGLFLRADFWTGKGLGMCLRQVPRHEVQGHDLRSLRRQGDAQRGSDGKRMGHIELAAPVVHIWFFKAMPSRLGNLLGMKTSSLEKVIYFQDHVVTDPGIRRSKSSNC